VRALRQPPTARPGRQPGCHDGVREATVAVSACIDVLRATGGRAELVEISRPHDTDAAWQIRGLNRLSASICLVNGPITATTLILTGLVDQVSYRRL